METEVVPISPGLLRVKALEKRLKVRQMTADEFIDRHASGTLRKNKSLGFSWFNHYLHERVAFEFGWTFECLPRSRVTFGDAITEGDCKGLTEAGWFADRYIALSIFPEDKFEVKYFHIEYTDGSKKEGVGLIVRQTSAKFVPKGHIVLAIITEFDPKTGEFKPAENPC